MTKKVLIIDDNYRNIFALKAVLNANRYTCLTASDASEGLAQLRDNNIGIVLMDMMLPDSDGYETIPLLKKQMPHLPVISVTAQAMPGDKQRCLDAGADHYLAKPIDVDELLAVLKKYARENE